MENDDETDARSKFDKIIRLLLGKLDESIVQSEYIANHFIKIFMVTATFDETAAIVNDNLQSITAMLERLGRVAKKMSAIDKIISTEVTSNSTPLSPKRTTVVLNNSNVHSMSLEKLLQAFLEKVDTLLTTIESSIVSINFQFVRADLEIRDLYDSEAVTQKQFIQHTINRAHRAFYNLGVLEDNIFDGLLESYPELLAEDRALRLQKESNYAEFSMRRQKILDKVTITNRATSSLIIGLKGKARSSIVFLSSIETMLSTSASPANKRERAKEIPKLDTEDSEKDRSVRFDVIKAPKNEDKPDHINNTAANGDTSTNTAKLEPSTNPKKGCCNIL